MHNFKQLIKDISFTHNVLQQQAVNAINQTLTIRNWLIGFYIVEFEQNGKDRAKYGSRLLDRLEDNFKKSGIKNMTARRFRDYRTFYLYYPQIRRSLTAILYKNSIRRSLGVKLPEDHINDLLESEYVSNEQRVNEEYILSKLSYTHIEQLIGIEEKLKRTFYEIECIKGTWSVRELKRQISSLYYERSGLSTKPEKLSEIVHNSSKPQETTDIIKNIYAFEFLNLNIKDVVEESDLEIALIDNLQEFIMEMGNGFCFEARQKRIIIGNKYYFIDLVFYHRILKCHVLVDLKIGAFEHGDIGQLNTYLNYFKKEVREVNDNPSVGILLVAYKDQALVKYATAGMDENLFVQKYLIQLPGKKQLEEYIDNELKKIR